MHICVSIALFACLWTGVERRCYAYLCEYRPPCKSMERCGEEIFTHIYVSIALFACLWKGVERRFHAYNRQQTPDNRQQKINNRQKKTNNRQQAADKQTT